MKVVVFGATGGTGRAVVDKALAAGHQVRAVARHVDGVSPAEGLAVMQGDAMDGASVRAALEGQEAVVISLGNSQNPFALLLGARRTTARDVCEVGTRNILAALPAGRPLPLIVVGAFGTGDTAPKLPLMFKLFYRLVLREQMADKEKQQSVLKASSVPYTLIQPTALTDKPGAGTWTTSEDGSLGETEVSREDLATFIVQRLAATASRSQTITFSG